MTNAIFHVIYWRRYLRRSVALNADDGHPVHGGGGGARPLEGPFASRAAEGFVVFSTSFALCCFFPEEMTYIIVDGRSKTAFLGLIP